MKNALLLATVLLTMLIYHTVVLSDRSYTYDGKQIMENYPGTNIPNRYGGRSYTVEPQGIYRNYQGTNIPDRYNGQRLLFDNGQILPVPLDD